MRSAFIGIVRRELIIFVNQPQEWLMPCIFFLLVVSLFTLTLQNQASQFHVIGPSIIWVAITLSLLLSIETSYQTDFHEGVFEQFILSTKPLSLILLAKALAHSIGLCLPLMFLVPFASLLLHLSANSILALMFSLVLGIPSLCLIASFGAFLTIGLKRGGLLLAVIIMPMMIPIIIFACGCVTAASLNESYHGELLLLSAILLASLMLVPIASSAALRVGLE